MPATPPDQAPTASSATHSPEQRRVRPRQVFSDLLTPAPEPAPSGEEPTTALAAPPTPVTEAPAHPDGQPAIPRPRDPVAGTQLVGSAGQAPQGDSAPAAGASQPEEEFDPKAGPPVGVIVGAVIVGATVLVLAALGMPYLMSKLRGPAEGPTYAVGDCVVQQGDNAVLAECTASGAYEIVSRVAIAADCPDPTSPTVAAGEDVFCLEAAGAHSAEEQDGPTDDASAGPDDEASEPETE